MSTTALTIAADAFSLLNVFQPGESVPASDGQAAFRALNRMIGQWQLDTMLPAVSIREVFPLVANKGGPDAPYTIGSGGDFDTTRPTAQSLLGAALLLSGTVPRVEIPRVIYTDAQYQAIQIKDLANSLWTGVYYNPSYTGGLGSLGFWPVPNTAIHDFILYRQQPLSAFVSLAATYDLPDGYEEAIVYNLARRLATPYGRTLDEDAQAIAQRSLLIVQRSNVQMSDLAIDPMFAGSARRGYNILTDEG